MGKCFILRGCFWYNGALNMKDKFEIIDHTADVGIAAYGSDLAEAFANAARGMFSLMVDLDSVGDTLRRAVAVRADNREDLLVVWLNELIYLCEVENVLFGRFEVSELTERELGATCFGERIDPKRHQMKIGIKATTYHKVRVEEGKGGCRVQVLFDI
jgi:SHS2 domain-containing protein